MAMTRAKASQITTKLGSTGTVRGLDDKLAERVSVLDFGADPTGVEDSTGAFNLAIATGKRVFVPLGNYLVSNIQCVSGMFIEGERRGGTSVSGTRLLVGTNNAGAFAHTTSTTVQNVTIKSLGILAAPGVTGARAYIQSDKSQYFAYCTFEDVETWGNLEISYDGFFIFCDWVDCRDGFYGTPPSGQTHQGINSTPAAFGQLRQCNLNSIRQSEFFRSTNPDGAVDIAYGVNWSITGTDFENITGLAVRARGVHNLSFSACWFEAVDNATVVSVNVSPAPNAQGSRPTTFNDCHCFMYANNTSFVTIGSSSRASVMFCTFANVPVGTVLAVNPNRLYEIFNTQVLSGSSATFLPSRGSYLDAASASTFSCDTATVSGDLSAGGRIATVALLKTGLTDNPGAPETVATFTMPTVTQVAGQVLDSAIIELDAAVTAVSTTTTIYAVNRQRLRIAAFVNKDGSVTADLATSDPINRTSGGGTWTSLPVWSVSVSGYNIALQVTSNPGGGSFTNGIRAGIVGEMRSTGSFAFSQPTYA